ncbi:MAG: hypothetical protein NNA22_09765 [Nitrospira sp.]|nr:hypothetical protein [Nitrospira sp.]
MKTLIKKRLLILGMGLVSCLGPSYLMAGPLEEEGLDHPYQEVLRTVHQAAHEVDDAWAVYHRAALGGTVASPALQATIEEHLHEARTLITQALEAARQGDNRTVEHLVNLVRIHTTHAIKGSQEPKK